MTPTWEGSAPAKVNLFLRVTAREASGYHQIETLFQRLELADEVSLALRTDGEVRLQVEGVPEGTLGPEDGNLAVRAARAFAGALARQGVAFPGVDIRVVKKTPAGGGLGGGSSDAAAVLRGLNHLTGAPMGPDDLLPLGGTLGADVPFFLTGAPLALGWGRGDRLLPLPPLPPSPVLLAIPPFPVETPEAYRLLAMERERIEAGVLPAGVLPPEDLMGWEGVARLAENAFQGVLDPRHPILRRIRNAMEMAGARVALLSGSGSTIFGVFDDDGGVARARGALTELSDVHVGGALRLVESRTAVS